MTRASIATASFLWLLIGPTLAVVGVGFISYSVCDLVPTLGTTKAIDIRKLFVVAPSLAVLIVSIQAHYAPYYSKRGRAYLARRAIECKGGGGWSRRIAIISILWLVIGPSLSAFGAGVILHTAYDLVPGFSFMKQFDVRLSVVLPSVAVLLLSVFMHFSPYYFSRVRIALARRRAKMHNLCPACAYPVGTSPVCTECGRRVLAKSIQ